jgi:hypothetical protein
LGLYNYNTKTEELTVYKNDPKNDNSLSGRETLSMLEDKKGRIWIGTDNGLELLDKKTGTFKHFRHNPNNSKTLSNSHVFSLLEDDNGNIWIATGRGLNKFNPESETFTVYTEKNGLANNFIVGLLSDDKGNIWMSSSKGLSRFNPVTNVCRNYTTGDGLQGDEFRHRAAYKDKNGFMFFGGVNGFNVFHPDSIKDDIFIPPVVITDFHIFNKDVKIGDDQPLQKHISEASEIRLNYEQSVFTFEFAALNYSMPKRSAYAYKLEGFDKDWTYTGDIHTATYTNLDPGEYTFHVTGSNNDGVWNKQGTSIRITITPPFWLTWWFKAALGLFTIGIIITFFLVSIGI